MVGKSTVEWATAAILGKIEQLLGSLNRQSVSGYCKALQTGPSQHIGKLFVSFRQAVTFQNSSANASGRSVEAAVASMLEEPVLSEQVNCLIAYLIYR